MSGSAWKAALDGVESKWTPDGAWGDDTAAGLVSVALCRFATGEADGSKNEKVQIGVRRLAAHYAPEKEPRTLNGVERVGGLLSTPRLGEQEWYTPGAKALAAAQQPDGSWVEEGDPVLGTSRALLFLTRSTAALKAVTKRGGAGRLELKSIGGCTNLMFVLDASGYMRQDLDNKERFEVAKETIAKIVDKLPEGAVVGLRAFGHRKGANEPGCETDSQLVTAPGPVNKRQMVTHMESIQVKGWSPLTFSLIETVKDLSRVPPDVPMAVVLLVDGLDTDRKANPIPAAGDLAGSRPGLKVHVVGFNTDDDEIRVRLRKMADAGGGVFIPARTSKDILPKLMTATIGEQDFTLLNEKGETVVKGRMGDTKELPEGVYTLVVGKFKEQIWVNPGQVTRIIVNQEKLAGK